MHRSVIPTIALKFTEARPRLSELLDRVFQLESRIVIRKGSIPVAAIVSIGDLRRLEQIDLERDAAFAVLDAIGTSFATASPEEIGDQVARAIADIRTDVDVPNLQS